MLVLRNRIGVHILKAQEGYLSLFFLLERFFSSVQSRDGPFGYHPGIHDWGKASGHEKGGDEPLTPGSGCTTPR